MKNVYIYAVVLTGLFISYTNVNAQGSLGLYTTSVSNSNPAMGEEFSLLTKLINTSSLDTFSGFIDFDLANENGIITDVSVFGEPQVSGTQLTLAPLQEMFLLFTITPLPAYFTPGPDIIIVWPITTAPVVDSARAAINIKTPTDIDETGNGSCKIFVHNSTLYVQVIEDKYMLQHVQIFGINGQLLISKNIHEGNTSLSINELSNGLYIAEVVMSNGNTKRLKFNKQ